MSRSIAKWDLLDPVIGLMYLGNPDPVPLNVILSDCH